MNAKKVSKVSLGFRIVKKISIRWFLYDVFKESKMATIWLCLCILWAELCYHADPTDYTTNQVCIGELYVHKNVSIQNSCFFQLAGLVIPISEWNGSYFLTIARKKDPQIWQTVIAEW